MEAKAAMPPSIPGSSMGLLQEQPVFQQGVRTAGRAASFRLAEPHGSPISLSKSLVLESGGDIEGTALSLV